MPRRPVTIDDLFRIRLVSDPQISPDGKTIAFVQTGADLEKNLYRSHIWLVPSDGSSPPRQFTAGSAKDRAPRWSPDGKSLAFISNRDKQDQLYLIAMDGGEARQLTSGEGKPSAAVWSPDGAMIAYTAKVITDSVKHANGVRAESDVRSYTRLNYRTDADGFWDYGWRQVFVMAVTPEIGEAIQLTRGDYNHADPAWAPDSRTIAFSANRTAQADLSVASDIWLVPVPTATARGKARVTVPRKITRSTGPSQAPAFSPDGNSIAFVGHDNRFTRNVTLTRVYVMKRDGSELRCLTEAFDRGVGDRVMSDLRVGDGSVTLCWDAGGDAIYFVSTDHGASNVQRVGTADGVVSRVTHGTHGVFGWSYARSTGQIAYECSSFTNPNDIFVQDGAEAGARRLTRVNDDLVRELALSQPARVQFHADDGWPVEGWVMKPAGFKAGRKYPTILSIHGGPHSTYGAAYFHEFQLLCAAGYAVLFTNPRGSDSYGQDFVKATYQDWGGGDYRDLMAALDGALQKFPWMDAKRLGVMGGSYGGYMTGWIVTHTTRFKVAIAERMLSNWYSFFGTSDIGSIFGTDWEVGGRPWDNPDGYLGHSPIAHVANCKTPTLVLHSENDFRCPIEQGEQFYVALRNLRVPAQFVRFPGESHDLSRKGQPGHRKERFERITEWLKKHL